CPGNVAEVGEEFVDVCLIRETGHVEVAIRSVSNPDGIRHVRIPVDQPAVRNVIQVNFIVEVRGYQQPSARVKRQSESQMRIPDHEALELSCLSVKAGNVIGPEGEITRVEAVGQYRGDIEVAVGAPDDPEGP